jgi:hypothetical protein
MKAHTRGTLVLVQLLALHACATDQVITCTDELRSAVVVHVSSPGGLAVDGVSAMREGGAHECESSLFYDAGSNDAGAVQSYTCWEQGGGTYVVRVKSGASTWTKRVEIDTDGCFHVTEQKTLNFVLDPKTAD